MIRECVLVALLAGCSSALLVCAPDYCEKMTCEELKCEANQTVLQNATFCGCCPACGTILKAGAECPTVKVIGGPPPTIVCEKGFKCINGRCRVPSESGNASTTKQSE